MPHERDSLLTPSSPAWSHHHHQQQQQHPTANQLTSLFERPVSIAQIRSEHEQDDELDETQNSARSNLQEDILYWTPIQDKGGKDYASYHGARRISSSWRAAAAAAAATSTCSFHNLTTTAIGSIIFLIYHVVFCLAQAATVAPTTALTGQMAKIAALGVASASPVFIWQLGAYIPAIYPASDLFLAPFLAQVAEIIHHGILEQQQIIDNLANDSPDGSHEEDDSNNYSKDDKIDNTALFLTTFLVTSGLGLFLSGGLCIIAARFSKLANLGAFLPYSVLSGFFTTIGLLMWTLGFSVDTGLKVGQVWHAAVVEQNWPVVKQAFWHHTPSLCIGTVMHVTGRMHSNYWVIGLIVGTVVGSYGVLWITNTTVEEAQEAQWFFSAKDLAPPPPPPPPPSSTTATNSDSRHPYWMDYGPPLPLGVWFALLRGQVVWKAVWTSVPTMLALAFLYIIRCSLHSAALKKNIPNLTRKKQHASSSSLVESKDSIATIPFNKSQAAASIRAKKEKQQALALGNILEKGYGYSQLIAALFGGITVAPSVAASLTLFRLGAEGTPPQYGSCALLLIFYVTNFQAVQYIPKPAFSSLMVLAAIDMCRNWMVQSFFKCKDKVEWMVAPILVVLAFSVGVLPSIFLGVAASTFIFVANFYRAGIVKFVSSGLTLRSTVERGPREAAWLDQNADLIQILVLQNYLFFGNAQSVLNYVSTMFDDDEEEEEFVQAEQQQGLDGLIPIPPVPKYLIIDFAMCTGMDTSAVDLFGDIVALCRDHHCQLFFSGTSPNMRSLLLHAGMTRSSSVNYVDDLETALARAEDGLLSTVLHWEEEAHAECRQRSDSVAAAGDDGFLYALSKIDQVHGVKLARSLKDFQKYTIPIELAEGEILVRDENPGVYFVEFGVMRVRPATTHSTMSLTSSMGLDSRAITAKNPNMSLGHLDARASSLGRERAALKQERRVRPHDQHNEQTFRLARIGQGWVIGSIETANGLHNPGIHVAIAPCRLHHLPRNIIQDMETKNPTLSMNLYKLLSLLATKRQEATIHQLDQFVKIMNAPVPRLRGGKRELAKLQIA